MIATNRSSSDWFVCRNLSQVSGRTRLSLQISKTSSSLLTSVIHEELPGFHPVISVLHRPHSTKRQMRARFSQQAWKERTNHRTRYTRSLSISGKARYDPFSCILSSLLYSHSKHQEVHFVQRISKSNTTNL